MSNTINLDFFPGSAAEKLSAASEYLKKHSGTELRIPAGEYDITSPLAKKTMDAVFSGELGKNPEKIMFKPDFRFSVGFDLSDTENCTVNADGAVFFINGFMEPISIKNSRSLTLRGLTIDHRRKPYSKGQVVYTKPADKGENNGYIDVEFSQVYPLAENTPFCRLCFYDTYAARFVDYGNFKTTGHEMLSDGMFRFFGSFQRSYSGSELYVWHTFHSRPAILIENSEKITLENVTIHSQPGMGVVAHRNNTLTFRGFRVIPSVGEHVSTNTDATHITSTKGTVLMENCVFSGQGDDALNIHTYFHAIERLDSRTARLRLEAPTFTHSQSLDYPDAGDILELTRRGTLASHGNFKVISVTPDFTSLTSTVTLDRELPDDCENYYFSDITRCPSLIYRNNLSLNHLARGVLIKTKNALIENNTFSEVVGTPIHVTAEEYWREGLCTTENIIIRHNRILNCARTNDIRQRGSGGICVSVYAGNPVEITHGRVEIIDNIIECPDAEHAIYVSNTRELILSGNQTRCASGEDIVTEETTEPDI